MLLQCYSFDLTNLTNISVYFYSDTQWVDESYWIVAEMWMWCETWLVQMGAEYKVHTKLLTEFETLGVMG